MDWLRWHHGCITDPKFQLVARRSGQNVASVLAVWAALLERASQAQERGSVSGFDCDSVDTLFGLEDGACQSILTALEAKGMITDDRIVKWDERQNKDETSAERKRLQREREKLSQERAELEGLRASCHAMSQDVTDGHAMSLRLDKIREEKNTNTPSSAGKDNDARARDDGARDVFDFSDEPGLEFLELRRFYDEQARAEAPLTGFAEYKQLRASRRWPGQASIYDAIARHRQADPAGWQGGFAPGLARFLRENWWNKTPTARASPAPQPMSWIDRENARTTAEIEAFERQQAQAQEAQNEHHAGPA